MKRVEIKNALAVLTNSDVFFFHIHVLFCGKRKPVSQVTLVDVSSCLPSDNISRSDNCADITDANVITDHYCATARSHSCKL